MKRNTDPKKGCTCPAPLSPVALGVLEWLKSGPKPRQEVNPGIVTKLVAEGYAKIELRPSPYIAHIRSKRSIEHLRFAHEPIIDADDNYTGYFRDSSGGVFTKCTCFDD